jgi:hypothetical protein
LPGRVFARILLKIQGLVLAYRNMYLAKMLKSYLLKERAIDLFKVSVPTANVTSDN